MDDNNVDWWQKVVSDPTPAFEGLFDTERRILTSDVIPKNSFVLDVGCGYGRSIESLTKRTTNIRGVDADVNAVNHINNTYRHSSNICAERIDSAKLPYEDGIFDVVALMMVLPNLGDAKKKCMSEIARVLRLGGKFILSTYAETALHDRIYMYGRINAPIKSTAGSRVTLKTSAGDVTSDQFSISELIDMGLDVGLYKDEAYMIGNLAYIVTYKKE